MWPTFVVLTLLDGFLVHWRPPVGDSASAVAGWLLGTFLSLAGFLLVAPLLAIPIRRIRSDMPRVVARDYAGAFTTVLVTVAILVAGLAHRATVLADRAALLDATARATGYIGDHAPARFRQNLSDINTYVVQPPVFYRVCVTAPMSGGAQGAGGAANSGGATNYCVVVDRAKPFSSSVRYAGSESNALLSQGTS